MDFKQQLKEWNGGVLRGAARALSKKIEVSESYVSYMLKGRIPGEDVVQKIAAQFKMGPEDVLALFRGKVRLPTGIESGSVLRDVPMMPVLGRVHADTYGVVFDAPSDDTVPNPFPDKNLYALRVKGDCMEPKLSDGDIIYVDPRAEPRDGQVVVALLDGEHTLKRFQRKGGIAYLVPDNKKYQRIKVTTSKAVIRGVVVSALRKNI